jgi:glycosyltransferase involved in cell wall biosynthesis
VASAPRVAIGAPVYNNAAFLPLALDSLLAQTFGDFGLVLVDDASTDETAEIAERYAARDERVVYHRNPERLGIIRSWRRAHDLALELFPSAEYYAWASDHDVWRPEWLEQLVARLDRAPEAVLVYPLNIRISGTGELMKGPWHFSTESLGRASARLWRTCLGMRAGSMVYGLYRRAVLDRLRVYRWVREPDNLMMAELAIQGEFHQIPEILWERRFGGLASRERQLATCFLDEPPWYSRLPAWIEHAGVIFWRYVLSSDRPLRSRLRGLLYWLEFVVGMAVAVTRRWTRRRFWGTAKRLRKVKRLSRTRKSAVRRVRRARGLRATRARTEPARASRTEGSRDRP